MLKRLVKGLGLRGLGFRVWGFANLTSALTLAPKLVEIQTSFSCALKQELSNKIKKYINN